jgi:hypothetical protein
MQDPFEAGRSKLNLMVTYNEQMTSYIRRYGVWKVLEVARDWLALMDRAADAHDGQEAT